MIVSTYDNYDSADSMTGEYSKLTKLYQSVIIGCRNVYLQLIKAKLCNKLIITWSVCIEINMYHAYICRLYEFKLSVVQTTTEIVSNYRTFRFAIRSSLKDWDLIIPPPFRSRFFFLTTRVSLSFKLYTKPTVAGIFLVIIFQPRIEIMLQL